MRNKRPKVGSIVIHVNCKLEECCHLNQAGTVVEQGDLTDKGYFYAEYLFNRGGEDEKYVPIPIELTDWRYATEREIEEYNIERTALLIEKGSKFVQDE